MVTVPPRPRSPHRNGGRAIRVPDVETQRCPARPGPHWLTNDAAGNTYCRGCKVAWAQLDAEIRAARGWRAAS